MSVWADIDKLKAKFALELQETANGLEGEGGVSGSLTTDEFGRWTCRYIPKGSRIQTRLSAKSGRELVAALKAIRTAEGARPR